MSAGLFTITELGPGGNFDVAGERFVWTSDRTPAQGVTGGARATPRRPWAFGGQQRHVRTDYPGARTPSIQVLGPAQKNQTLTGRWDDRYNFSGYAVQEMRRFEEMAQRGNRIRIQYQEQAFDCLLVEWEFAYDHRGQINYSFSVLAFDRTEKYDVRNRSQAGPKTPSQAVDEVDLTTIALESTQTSAPRAQLVGNRVKLVDTQLAAVVASRDQLSASFAQQEISSTTAVSPFRKLASQFRNVRDDALELQATLLRVRSDVDTATNDALTVLNFETWSRTMRANTRLLVGTSALAAFDVEERATPEIGDLYRPSKGESLYRISLRFYGTPHSWRLIYDRNNLQSTTLTGDELLLIPRRGQG